tara:strand:- start:1191 stop:2414 length:1224 start_codon:yes stop_codon:yes gene_type:complete
MDTKSEHGVRVTRRQECSACTATDLATQLRLPGLPLTGVFVHPEDRDRYSNFDQALLRCTACGHVQLQATIDPVYLYQETYTHRSSLSPISTRGNDFFLSFLNDLTGDQRFSCVAEVGCNDFYLLNKLKHRGDSLVGFDPIWKDLPLPDAGPIQVKGKYIEEIDPAADLPSPPDLVLSVHTLEHVDLPYRSLRPLFDHARPGALFVVEIPSLDSLVNAGRFDQVFHQHLNYFSLASFRRMIHLLGGDYVAHRFNYGYWLGTMLIAFRKPGGEAGSSGEGGKTPPPTSAEIDRCFTQFRHHMGLLRTSIDHLVDRGVKVYGYGAAQMAPILAYHMESDWGFLECILDDNSDKWGLTYPGLQVAIESPQTDPSFVDGAVVITAVDSARAILHKLTDLGTRYILQPFSIL